MGKGSMVGKGAMVGAGGHGEQGGHCGGELLGKAVKVLLVQIDDSGMTIVERVL